MMPLPTQRNVAFRAVADADSLRIKVMVDHSGRKRAQSPQPGSVPAEAAVGILNPVGGGRQKLVGPTLKRVQCRQRCGKADRAVALRKLLACCKLESSH